MNCYQCGGVYEERSDVLEVFDFYVGRIEVEGIPYYRCRDCSDIVYTEEMSRAIETERRRRISELLNQSPLSHFVGSAEAAAILGISRQAMHKNRRIRRGFIYQTEVAGVTVYLKGSVHRFKNTGDGRFPLARHKRIAAPTYAEPDVGTGSAASYEHRPMRAQPAYPFREQQSVFPREGTYAH